jgi:hypothetical protein
MLETWIMRHQVTIALPIKRQPGDEPQTASVRAVAVSSELCRDTEPFV